MGRSWTDLGAKGDLEKAESALVLHDGLWALKTRITRAERRWWYQ